MIQGFEAFKKVSIKDISYDQSSKEHMSMSKYEALNFDEIKDNFMKDLSKNSIYCKSTLSSNDGIFVKNDEIYFIEFKNGKIFDNKKSIKLKSKEMIYYKILYSIFIFLSYHSNYRKEKMNYILVYNKHKNSDRAINKCLKNYAKEKAIFLDLSFFEERYFKKTYCFDQDSFEKFINS